MYFYQLFFVSVSFHVASAVVDYCDVDKSNYSISAPGIQFTKELSSSEYAVLSSFKSLHCCAKGYSSIEWFKDGKAYPWPGDISSFILYPESANQTIYSQSLNNVDTGNYTCTVANDTAQVSHTSSLTVFDMKKNYMDVPLPTYSLPAEHYVRLGQRARMYCEAFVGKIDLPDATNEVWWERSGFNMSAPEGRRYHQQPVSREDGQILGSYLFIDKVKRADFGEYICSISNTQDQVVHLTTIIREEWNTGVSSNKIPWLKLQFVIIFVLLVTSIVIIYKRFSPSVFLFLKLKFCKRPLNDGKENDVLICHSVNDTNFALHILAATLRDHYNFTVALHQDRSTQVDEELQITASQSRSLLIVLSPSLFGNQWSPGAMSTFFKQVTSIHDSIICVSLQAVKADSTWKSKEGSDLQKILKKCTIIEWHKSNNLQGRFWTSLRLKLPPPSAQIPVGEIESCEMDTTSTTTKAKLSTLAKSNESLEVLV